MSNYKGALKGLGTSQAGMGSGSPLWEKKQMTEVFITAAKNCGISHSAAQNTSQSGEIFTLKAQRVNQHQTPLTFDPMRENCVRNHIAL